MYLWSILKYMLKVDIVYRLYNRGCRITRLRVIVAYTLFTVCSSLFIVHYMPLNMNIVHYTIHKLCIAYRLISCNVRRTHNHRIIYYISLISRCKRTHSFILVNELLHNFNLTHQLQSNRYRYKL